MPDAVMILPDAKTVIAVRDLSVAYGRVQALKNLSFDCGPGVTGLIGVNGAGKTTLLRVLATLQRPDAGRVLIRGADISSSSGRARVRATLGYAPQAASLPGNLTVNEVLVYMAWMHKVGGPQRAHAVDRALARCQLTDLRDRKVRTLSGGMARRVLLAQAIVHKPTLVLLDEPTVGLDPEQRVAFRDVLRNLGDDTCVLLSTHLIEDISHTATRVLVLEAGSQVFSGSVTELAKRGQGVSIPGDSDLERGFMASRVRMETRL